MSSKAKTLSFLNGELDGYIPITACYHFGQQHLDGKNHANLEVEFFRKFRPDILKVMNDYSFRSPSAADNKEFKFCKETAASIASPQYAEQLVAIKEISRQISGDVVIWDTVFNPWFTARRHVLFADINKHMKENPDETHVLLNFITENIIDYIQESAVHGAEGFFYSVPAAPKYLSHDEFLEFMKPYDDRVLKKIRETEKTVALHLHGTGDVYFRDIVDTYDFDILSWSSKNTSVDLGNARKMTDKILMSGIDEDNEFNYRTYGELEKEVNDALSLMRGSRFILSPGCVLPPQCPTERLQYMFNYARSVR